MKKTLALIFNNIRKNKLFVSFSVLQAVLCITFLALSFNYFYISFDRYFAFMHTDLQDCYQTNGEIIDKSSDVGETLYKYLDTISDRNNWMISLYHFGNFKGKDPVQFSAFNKGLAEKAYIPIVDGSWFDTSSDEIQIIIPDQYAEDKSIKLGDYGKFCYYNYPSSGKKDLSFNARVVGVYDHSLCTEYRGGYSISNMYKRYSEGYGLEKYRPLILYIPDFEKIGAYGYLNSAFIEKSLVKNGVDLSKNKRFCDTSTYLDEAISKDVIGQGSAVIAFVLMLICYAFAAVCSLSIMRQKKARHTYALYNLSGCSIKKCIGIEFATQFIPFIIGLILSIIVFTVLVYINIGGVPTICFILSCAFNIILMMIVFLQTVYSLSKNKIINSVRMGSNERYY